MQLYLGLGKTPLVYCNRGQRWHRRLVFDTEFRVSYTVEIGFALIVTRAAWHGRKRRML
jgi:hypothetical protein